MAKFKNEPPLFFDKTQNQLQVKIDEVIEKYRSVSPVMPAAAP